MKLDILAIMAHPDDAELCCSGTIARHIAQGKKVGIIDLTAGELGTRGTPEIRLQESKKSAEILGLSARENLGFQDGFFQNDREHQLQVIQKIRQYQPEIVIANAPKDRHPDHSRGSELTVTSCFLAGLSKIETALENVPQMAYRPKQIFHVIQSDYLTPDFVVDISDYRDKKVKSILAYETQFFNPENVDSKKGKQTFISTPDFFDFLEGRDREFGQAIRVKYGEGFIKNREIGVRDFFDLI